MLSCLSCLWNSFFHHQVTITTCSWYNSNSSILDLLLTNEKVIISGLCHLSALEKSDHSILTINFQCYIQHKGHYRMQCSYRKGDYSSMRAQMTLDWTAFLKKMCWWSMVDIHQSCWFCTGQPCLYWNQSNLGEDRGWSQNHRQV